MSSAPLLEREHQLGRLTALLDTARSGSGSIALVTGEAGIGKTSLVRAFCAGLGAQVRVLRAGCDPVEAPRPLGPLYDIARLTGGDIASVMAADRPRHEGFVSLLDLLAQGPPTVLVVEDVHWADGATLDLLTFVARRVDTVPALVVLTAREDALGTRVLRGLDGLSAVHRVVVPALSIVGLRELAGPAAEDLLRRTGGNAFYVSEVLASAAGEVPVTVRDAVLTRLAGLSPSAREVAELVAVVPDHADLELVRASTRAGAAELAEPETAGLLVATEGRSRPGLRYRHDITREAVEWSLTTQRAADLHHRVLVELARRPGARPALLSLHADRAGDGPAVLVHAPRAAQEASRLGSHREAAIHLGRALAHADLLEPAGRADLLEARTLELESLGEAGEAAASATEAVAVRRLVGDLPALSVALSELGRQQWNLLRGADADATIAEAVELAESGGDPRARCAAYTAASLRRMLARDIPEAIRLGERAIVLARETEDRPRLSRALNAVGTSYWLRDPERAQQMLVESMEVARRAQQDSGVAHALVNLGSGAGEVRQYDVSLRWLTEAATWCAQRDLDARGSYATAWLARVHLEQGRWAEAAAVSGPLVDSPTAISRFTALVTLGRLWSRTGRAGCDRLLDEAWDLAVATGDLQRLWPAAAARAERAVLLGQPDRVPALVGDTLTLATRLGHPWATGELAVLLVRAGVPPGDVDAGTTPFGAELVGDHERAARAWEELGCPWEAAWAWLGSGDATRLSQAVLVLHGLGARGAADRAAARLRAVGGTVPRRPRPATVSNPAGLTHREVEVRDLLVEGLTDADIAARLHISPKTAGHHVSAVLAKLGVRSRREVR